MKKIKSGKPRRDRNRPEKNILDSKTLKKALKLIEKYGLNTDRLQLLLRLPNLVETDKIVFHLQSHLPNRLQKSLTKYRNNQILTNKISKWEYNPEKKIQSLEYYLSL